MVNFSMKAQSRLKYLHPDLLAVVNEVARISELDFTVLEGARSLERQKQLFASGASKTMNSRHLVDAKGFCYAVDLAPVQLGKISWAWPLYHILAETVKTAAKNLEIRIEWGGDWTSFKDGPHWQLPHDTYPAKA